MSLSKYHSQYVPEDSFAEFHQYDDSLPLIKIPLPSVESFYGLPWDEAIQKIDGYGLDPSLQHFEHYRALGFYKMPDRLRDIEEVVRKKLKKKPEQNLYPDEIFDHIENDPLYYEEEIKWIQKQQARSERGTWIFIKGKPTYIDGIHYCYLLCWPIANEYRPKDGLPFYRDIDRRIFLFFRWAYTTKSAYFKWVVYYKKKNGELATRFFNDKIQGEKWAIREGYKFYIEPFEANVEQTYRTVFGVVFPKRRRVGGTKQSVFFLTMITLQTRNGMFAIQALTKETAKDDVYRDKFLVSWKSFWFIFKPAHSAYDASGLKLYPDNSSLFSKDIKPHGGRISPRSSANKAFDGNRLQAYLNDEPGKDKDGNILFKFRDTIKNMLAQGLKIHGFAIYVSTFGEINEGGRQFFEMCARSYANQRNDNGHTQTGLVTMFIPAFDGYDNCIDIYGQSIIEDPEDAYMNLEGEMMERGSKSVLASERMAYEQNKDWAGLNEFIRNNPNTLKEAHRRRINTENFNIEGLQKRIADLRYSVVPPTRRFNLEWSDKLSLTQRAHRTDITVVLKEDDNGKFYISQAPPPHKRNLFYYDHRAESWSPAPEVVDDHVWGLDAFKFGEKDATTNVKGLSKGAGVMIWKHDPILDSNDKLNSEWQSDRMVMHYLHRTEEPSEYAEDMLMASVLFGSLACHERNAGDIIRLWREWKFGAYLMYLINPTNLEPEKVPGVYTSKETHQKAFGYIQERIKRNVDRENHLEVLEQVLDTETLEDVTKNDLFAALEMAEIGVRNTIPRHMKEAGKRTPELKGLIPTFN